MTFRPTIAIVACQRPPPNAATLLVQMMQADPRARECPVRVSMDEATGPPSAARAAKNYMKALRMAREDSDYHLVIEDDTKMAHGWIEKLHDAVRVAEDWHPDRQFILLGYCHLGWDDLVIAHLAPANETFLAEYPESSALWGTVCILYPRALALEFAEALSPPKPIPGAHLAPPAPHTAYDEFLGVYCRLHKVPIYVILPNLAQHIGDVSLIHPTQKQRRSPTFYE